MTNFKKIKNTLVFFLIFLMVLQIFLPFAKSVSAQEREPIPSTPFPPVPLKDGALENPPDIPSDSGIFSIDFLKQFVSILRDVKTLIDKGTLLTFPFGGRITHSEGGCSLKFRVWVMIPIEEVPVPFSWPPPLCFFCPKIGIPLGGSTIEVGPPKESPPGQMFTLSGITDIYDTHSEGRVGPWALGLAFSPFPIDKINVILGRISINLVYPGTGCPGAPHTSFFWPYCYDQIELKCSESNDTVITKIGTSKE